MPQNIKIWFDPEADFLEVLFSDAPGYTALLGLIAPLDTSKALF